MDAMNRTTMRYPKLEQMITAAEFMLESDAGKIAEGAGPKIEMNLSKMRGLDRKIKQIPYDSGNYDTDRANAREYDSLENQADALIRETSDLLWPKEN